MSETGPARPRRTRVLFLAWGFSIHAQRRIGLFVEDPEFSVAVVSTHDYGFPDARNILLSGARALRRSDALIGWLVKIVLSCFDRKTSSREVRGWISDARAVRTAVREFRPDVVFLQTLLYPCYLAFLLPRSQPIVITFWNGDVVWWAKWNGIDRVLKKRIVTHGLRRARAITVNSRSAVEACLDRGATADKIHLIRYPGVDLDRFRPLDRVEARKALGIECGKLVLCPRGLGGYLNSDVIVESAARVAEAFPDALFLFVSGVGGEPEWKKHLGRAKELGIEKNLRWDGQVPWERMPLYYGAADAMVSIASNDSLPNCMLEAMACGIPVIMGDIPQIREWVTDGENGFLVPVRRPEPLAGCILNTFRSPRAVVDSFVRRNLELVRREGDTRKNVAHVKELVHRTAGARAAGEATP